MNSQSALPNQKLCSQCQTSNHHKFHFCKKCGAFFDDVELSDTMLMRTIQYGRPDFSNPPTWLKSIISGPDTREFILLKQLLMESKKVRWLDMYQHKFSNAEKPAHLRLKAAYPGEVTGHYTNMPRSRIIQPTPFLPGDVVTTNNPFARSRLCSNEQSPFVVTSDPYSEAVPQGPTFG